MSQAFLQLNANDILVYLFDVTDNR